LFGAHRRYRRRSRHAGALNPRPGYLHLLDGPARERRFLRVRSERSPSTEQSYKHSASCAGISPHWQSPQPTEKYKKATKPRNGRQKEPFRSLSSTEAKKAEVFEFPLLSGIPLSFLDPGSLAVRYYCCLG